MKNLGCPIPPPWPGLRLPPMVGIIAPGLGMGGHWSEEREIARTPKTQHQAWLYAARYAARRNTIEEGASCGGIPWLGIICGAVLQYGVNWAPQASQTNGRWRLCWRCRNAIPSRRFSCLKRAAAGLSGQRRGRPPRELWLHNWQEWLLLMVLHEFRCNYCERDIRWESGSGIDRLESSLPYIKSNAVPCCSFCNQRKGRVGAEEFRARRHHPLVDLWA